MAEPQLPMLETSARLLRLLSLLQSRRFWSGAELSEALEVTTRSVRRDVDRLRRLGYPVQGTAGVAGGYSLGVGGRLPPLLLAEDEAASVAFALRVVAAGAVSGMEEPALRSLAKLEQMLPVRIRKRVAKLYDGVVSLPGATQRVDAELLTVFASASRDEVQLHFGYGDKQSRNTTRHVEPHGLVHVGSRWYLAAYDVDRADFRTFRMDRVTSKARVGKRFARRAIPEGDLASYVSRSIGAAMGAESARILFHAPMAEVAQKLPRGVGRLSEAGAGCCQLETAVSDYSWLAVQLSLFGLDFEVLEPDGLVDAIKRMGQRLHRAHRASTRRRGAAEGKA